VLLLALDLPGRSGASLLLGVLLLLILPTLLLRYSLLFFSGKDLGFSETVVDLALAASASLLFIFALVLTLLGSNFSQATLIIVFSVIFLPAANLLLLHRISSKG
jgi:hypothetical protein